MCIIVFATHVCMQDAHLRAHVGITLHVLSKSSLNLFRIRETRHVIAKTQRCAPSLTPSPFQPSLASMCTKHQAYRFVLLLFHYFLKFLSHFVYFCESIELIGCRFCAASAAQGRLLKGLANLGHALRISDLSSTRVSSFVTL